ncbi:hypothetical protein CYMTET_12986 [Cymbomonas tetramitiformis]|uniref:Uncharacterized protein n=1 Tax=Cymbomonas tetramitiformis TaxID=36881 RepID=A0AAE0GJH6_9CHLO|nr:hypothetical protein CYMTET_12986 [Cymbomonas tetramitiformis]
MPHHSAEYAIDFVPNSHVERDSYVDPDSPELRPVEKVLPLAIRVVVPIDHLLLWASCIIHRAAEHTGSGDKLSTFMERMGGSIHLIHPTIGSIHFIHPTALDLLTAIDNLPSDDEGKQLLVQIVGAQLLDSARGVLKALHGNSKEGNKAGVEASGKILAQVLPVVNNASYSVQDLKATTIKNLMIWAEVATPLIEEHGQDPLTRFKDSSVVPTEVKSKVKKFLGSIVDRMRLACNVVNVVEAKVDVSTRVIKEKDSFLDETCNKQKSWISSIPTAAVAKDDDSLPSNFLKLKRALRVGDWEAVGTALCPE